MFTLEYIFKCLKIYFFDGNEGKKKSLFWKSVRLPWPASSLTLKHKRCIQINVATITIWPLRSSGGWWFNSWLHPSLHTNASIREWMLVRKHCMIGWMHKLCKVLWVLKIVEKRHIRTKTQTQLKDMTQNTPTDTINLTQWLKHDVKAPRRVQVLRKQKGGRRSRKHIHWQPLGTSCFQAEFLLKTTNPSVLHLQGFEIQDPDFTLRRPIWDEAEATMKYPDERAH